MPARPSQDEILLKGGGLGLRFVRLEDRYQQQLFAVADQMHIGLLTSIEGTPEEVWPSSPPLKQIDRLPDSGGVQLAFLVGMTAGSHWSLSAKLDERDQTIEFDVAARAGEPPGRLSSSYRLGDGVCATEGTDHIELTAGEVRCRIEHKGDVHGHRGRMEIRDGHLVLEPPAVSGPFPTTVCWRYTIKRIE